MTRQARFTLFTVVLLLFAVNGCKQGLFGHVSGTIVEAEHGMPLKDVAVNLEGTKLTLTTDDKGSFTFNNIPVGIYSVRCKKSFSLYRETGSEYFQVRTDSTTLVNIVLHLQPKSIHERRPERINLTSLDKNCALYAGRTGMIDNSKLPPTNVVLVKGSDRRIVSRFTGLRGYASIQTQDQALEFVRLFTGLTTQMYFKESNLDNAFIEVTPTERTPSIGEMPKHQYKRLGLQAPAVTIDRDGYTVTRFVTSFGRRLFKIKERVSFDGGYQVVGKELLMTRMEIPLPAYR